MPKSKHRKKTPKRKPKTNKPIKQTAKKATLNDTAQDIINLYGDYMMTPEYDDIPYTEELNHVEKDINRLINQIQNNGIDNDILAATLDSYFLNMLDAAEERGFVIGYQYAKTHADDEDDRIIYSDDKQIITVSDNLIDEAEDDIDNE